MGYVKYFKKNIPVTLLGEKSAIPMFSAFPPNNDIEILLSKNSNYTKNVISTAGIHTSRKQLPYQELPIYDELPTLKPVTHISIENEHICATLLPEWGGRLISIYHKKLKKELIYNPGQIILRNLAICNAWFAGGIEWNIGYYGHSAHTSREVFTASFKITEDDYGVRIFDFERMSSLWWIVDIILPEGSEKIFAQVSVYNDENILKPLYWWTNIAIEEKEGRRVYTASDKALWRSDIHGGFIESDFPIPENANVDYSYSVNFHTSGEFFFLHSNLKKSIPWIAVSEAEGMTFYEMSTPTLPHRKVFCWGTHQGGKNWQQLLHQNKSNGYFEIQAGLAPTQVHYSNIHPKQCVTWTHIFGHIQLDQHIMHGHSWSAASDYVDVQLDNIYKEQLRTLQACNQYAHYDINEMYTSGENWGYVHTRTSNSILPQWLVAHISCVQKNNNFSKEEKRWHDILHDNIWCTVDDAASCAWMVGIDYKEKLLAFEKDGVQDANLFLHLGIMFREQFDFSTALHYFLQSIKIHPNQIAYWGVIEIEFLMKNKNKVIQCISEALPIIKNFELKIELMKICVSMALWENLEDIISTLHDNEKKDKRLHDIVIQKALHDQDFLKAKELLKVPNYYIREGNVDVIDVWKQIHSKILKEGYPVPEIPENLDFRMNI